MMKTLEAFQGKLKSTVKLMRGLEISDELNMNRFQTKKLCQAFGYNSESDKIDSITYNCVLTHSTRFAPPKILYFTKISRSESSHGQPHHKMPICCDYFSLNSKMHIRF
jgi:hypothetical protein